MLRSWLADSPPRWLTRDDGRELLADLIAQGTRESTRGADYSIDP